MKKSKTKLNTRIRIILAIITILVLLAYFGLSKDKIIALYIIGGILLIISFIFEILNFIFTTLLFLAPIAIPIFFLFLFFHFKNKDKREQKAINKKLALAIYKSFKQNNKLNKDLQTTLDNNNYEYFISDTLNKIEMKDLDQELVTALAKDKKYFSHVVPIDHKKFYKEYCKNKFQNINTSFKQLNQEQQNIFLISEFVKVIEAENLAEPIPNFIFLIPDTVNAFKKLGFFDLAKKLEIIIEALKKKLNTNDLMKYIYYNKLLPTKENNQFSEETNQFSKIFSMIYDVKLEHDIFLDDYEYKIIEEYILNNIDNFIYHQK